MTLVPAPHRVLTRPAALLAGLAVVLSLTTAPPAEAAGNPLAGVPSQGECHRLTWSDYQARSDTSAKVPCGQDHSSRVIEVKQLPKGVGYGKKDRKARQRFVTSTCQPALNKTLGQTYPVREKTAYGYAWFSPTKAQRGRGAHWISCELVLLGGGSLRKLPHDRTPALADKTPTDTVRLCLDGKTRRTVCKAGHQFRSTGTFAISSKSYPGAKKIRATARQKCVRKVRSNSFYFTWRDKLTWQRTGDHVVVCYTKTKK